MCILRIDKQSSLDDSWMLHKLHVGYLLCVTSPHVLTPSIKHIGCAVGHMTLTRVTMLAGFNE